MAPLSRQGETKTAELPEASVWGLQVQGARNFTKWDPSGKTHPRKIRLGPEVGWNVAAFPLMALKTFKDGPSLMSSLRTHERGQGTFKVGSLLQQSQGMVARGVQGRAETRVF